MSLFSSITDAVLAAYPALQPGDIAPVSPPNREVGDVAVPLFLAAKRLGGNPAALAREAAEKVMFGPEVTSAAAAGPYLNLRLDRSRVGAGVVAEVLENGDRYGSGNTGAGRRVLIEHTSINPNASPHVGRGRCAMIGDSLARLLRFEGNDVEVHYYVNDMGRQIGLLVMIADEIQGLDFDGILDAYVRANARAESDPAFAEKGYALLSDMEEGDPRAQERFRQVTDLCLQGQLAVLHRVGATYDIFDRESAYVNDPRLAQIEEALRAKGALFTDDEQRLVVDLAPLGHAQEEGRYFVLRRANGSSMYGYRDLAYSLDKEEKGADVNLMVLGEDHKLYAQQLAMILQAAGHTPPEAVYYSYILLKDGKMSTRQGKVVLLSQFLDQASALARERVAEQCAELSPEEQSVIAETVAVAAIRFAVLRVKPGKNVTFDLEAALSFQGDTGPYVQYCCARINSILRRAGADAAGASFDAETFEASHDAEWAVVGKLMEFPQVVRDCLQQRAVAPVAGYALDLTHLFSSFYRDCPVLKAETPATLRARLAMCRATLQTLTNALHLLGITAPERM